GGHGTLFEVVESDDPGLDAYVDTGYLLPERNLRHYLALEPDASALVRSHDGTTVALSHSDGVKLPVLVEKLLLLRAVDTASPPRCQAAWLPAR
ncbi:MAG: hypothetical protein R3246_17685, partial [Acidimicrobiia bacterium]|nr:hypothetical protein [Acidimicrobiia bacterium]